MRLALCPRARASLSRLVESGRPHERRRSAARPTLKTVLYEDVGFSPSLLPPWRSLSLDKTGANDSISLSPLRPTPTPPTNGRNPLANAFRQHEFWAFTRGSDREQRRFASGWIRPSFFHPKFVDVVAVSFVVVPTINWNTCTHALADKIVIALLFLLLLLFLWLPQEVRLFSKKISR